MPDIFLSYNREDTAVAKRFADAFAREGLEVWWDATLRSGEAYDKVTEAALDGAKAVVVLWSPRSVDSRWVRAEATIADRNGTLMPVTIEPCKRPVMFELTQTADLSHWRGARNDKAWRTFLTHVRRMVEDGGERETEGPSEGAIRPAGESRGFWRSGRNRIAAAAAAMLIIGAGILYAFMGPGEHMTAPGAAAPANASTRTSIAVMPFANLTGDPAKDFLGEGMSEELINSLAKVPGLKVPARTSTFAYKGRTTDIRRIAQDLGVGSVLEGSVRSAGKRIRITAQLIDAKDGLHVWSETYDEEFTDLFTLQDKLAKSIVQALQVNLKGSSPVSIAEARPTQDLEAYQLYLQGSSLSDRISEQNLNRAIVYFQQAIARDPKFARAYAGLANAHSRLANPLGVRRFENSAAAERLARQALALNSGIAAAHATLSNVHDARGNWLESETHSAAALALGGNDGEIHLHRGTHLMRLGKLRDALAETRKAAELAPASPVTIANLAGRYSQVGRDAEALKYAALAIELGFPRDTAPLPSVYSNAALRAQRYAEAAEIEAREYALSDPERAQAIRLVYAALADPRQRARALAALERLYPGGAPRSPEDVDSAGPCLRIAYRHALISALDEAFVLANQCLDRMAPTSFVGTGGGTWLWSLAQRPFRLDPRFQVFAGRLGMMEYWQRYGPPDDCDLKAGKLTCH